MNPQLTGLGENKPREKRSAKWCIQNTKRTPLQTPKQIHVSVCVESHLDLPDLLRLSLDAAVVMDDANATHELWGKTDGVKHSVRKHMTCIGIQ